MTDRNAIVVQNLCRDFRVYEKEEGLLPALKSVFNRKWKTVHAVRDISFAIQPGEFVGFLGPNGAGKTTTLKMLSGILSPTRGTCSVLGHNPFKRERDFRKSVSMVMGQRSQLIWDLPPVDTFALHRDMYRLDKNEWKKTSDTLIDLLQVKHILQTPVRQLSLGERMKCETIVSLLHKPKALFLDEPTIGLDVISQRHLWEFLREYQKESGTTVMLTSHNMQDIANLCSRVIVINLGKLVYDGSLNELIDLTQPMKEVLVQFQTPLSSAEKIKLENVMRGIEWSQPENVTLQFHVPRERFSALTRQLLQDFKIDDIAVQEVDFSTVMQESFLMRPEEVPIRKIKNEFQRKINGAALNGE